MLFGEEESFSLKPVIKVIGVGGAGGNAVDRMIDYDVKGVEFIAVNTDAQDLRLSKANTRIIIGKNSNRGFGAGTKPEVGRNAALEDEDSLRAAISGANMVFITCGMGGGTGTGASPVIARICKELGCLTVAIVSKPFFFEGPDCMAKAVAGLEELKKYVDTLIVIPNQRLFSIVDPGTPLLQAFREVDDVLRQGVQGMAEIINFTGLINVDFADVTTVMKDKGTALMGIGLATGPNRAVEAARKAIHSNLLEVSIDGATDCIVNIASSEDVSLVEVNEALAEIRNNCDKNLNVIYGAYINNDLKDELVVTIIATGYELKAKENGIENLASEIFQNMSDTNIDYRRRDDLTALEDDGEDDEEEENDSVDHLFHNKAFERAEKKRLKLEAKENKKRAKEESKTTKVDEQNTQKKVNLPDWLTKK